MKKNKKAGLVAASLLEIHIDDIAVFQAELLGGHVITDPVAVIEEANGRPACALTRAVGVHQLAQRSVLLDLEKDLSAVLAHHLDAHKLGRCGLRSIFRFVFLLVGFLHVRGGSARGGGVTKNSGCFNAIIILPNVRVLFVRVLLTAHRSKNQTETAPIKSDQSLTKTFPLKLIIINLRLMYRISILPISQIFYYVLLLFSVKNLPWKSGNE